MAICFSELKSTQILDDCQRSLDLFEQVPDGDKQLFHIYWTFCLVALRSVEDALVKYDTKAYPEIEAPLKKRYEQLMALKKKYPENVKYEECDSDDYLIYHRLIRGERNSAVHEASHAYVDGMWSMVADKGLVNWGNTYLPMWDFDKWGGDDCRDWIQKGIAWWRKEIKRLFRCRPRKTSRGSTLK